MQTGSGIRRLGLKGKEANAMVYRKICRRKGFSVLLLASLIACVTLIPFLDNPCNEEHHGTSVDGRCHEASMNVFKVLAYQKLPQRHIYFLKMHKCASSTLQKIIMMYGLKHNLSFALPKGGRNFFYPEPFHPNLTKRTAAHPHFDIMAVHSRFTLSAPLYMPKDTVFVSVVRDPADQLISAFYYFYVSSCRKRINFEELMASDLRQYNRRIPYMRNFCAVNMLRNMQLYDFGIDLPSEPSKNQVQDAIRTLDSIFHVVVIVEMFDESLIVLRDFLGWKTSDMLYFRSNFRVNSSGMTARARAAAYAWNWADKALYDHFRDKMAAIIRERRDYIEEEVRKLRDLQMSLYRFCVDSGSLAVSNFHIGYYTLTEEGTKNSTCHRLCMPEASLIETVNAMRPEVTADG